MHIRQQVLGLAFCLLACGDDVSSAVDSGVGGHGGDGGKGGAGGAGGAGGRPVIGGHGAQKCRDDKTDTLSAWCDDDTRPCDLSLSARWKAICQLDEVCVTSHCYFSNRNSCGGYSIQDIQGSDVYAETYHYDATGTLVGVTVQPSPQPCAGNRDYYGTICERAVGSALDCDEADAGEP